MLLAAICACTPSPDRDPQSDVVMKQPQPPKLPHGAFVPHWRVGQKWKVKFDVRLGRIAGYIALPPDFTYFECKYEVVATAGGEVRIEAIRIGRDRGVKLRFRDNGVLLDGEQWLDGKDTMENLRVPHAPEKPYIALKYLLARDVAPPWWPVFPLVPGTEQYFDGGLLHQSVVKDAEGILIVVVTRFHDANDPTRFRRMKMTWDPKDPWWSEMVVDAEPPVFPHWPTVDTTGRTTLWGPEPGDPKPP